MQEGRKYSTLTTLPDGKCVVFGGSKQGTTSYVYSPEMFDPVTETWQSLTPCTVPRGYHSVAILLSDGRIWTAGNTPNTTIREFRTEIFSPWYVSESRPTITSVPNVGDYGGQITIRSPDAPSIDKISLVRLQSTTHHYDANLRFIWLKKLSKTADTVFAEAPLNSMIAPFGYYMIHIINESGVPSPGKIIKIPGSFTDSINPTLRIISPAAGQTISGPSTGVDIEVVGSATDNGSGIHKVEVMGGSSSTYEEATPDIVRDWSLWRHTIRATAAGIVNISVKASDNAGHSIIASLPVQVIFE
jgi:hypothetical protein